jgi:hypothetical protein
LTVSGWCPGPTFINVGRTIGLRKTIVALGRGGFNDYAKHFEVDQDGNDVASAARFHQFLINRLVASAFNQRMIVVSRHLIFFIFI